MHHFLLRLRLRFSPLQFAGTVLLAVVFIPNLAHAQGVSTLSGEWAGISRAIGTKATPETPLVPMFIRWTGTSPVEGEVSWFGRCSHRIVETSDHTGTFDSTSTTDDCGQLVDFQVSGPQSTMRLIDRVGAPVVVGPGIEVSFTYVNPQGTNWPYSAVLLKQDVSPSEPDVESWSKTYFNWRRAKLVELLPLTHYSRPNPLAGQQISCYDNDFLKSSEELVWSGTCLGNGLIDGYGTLDLYEDGLIRSRREFTEDNGLVAVNGEIRAVLKEGDISDISCSPSKAAFGGAQPRFRTEVRDGIATHEVWVKNLLVALVAVEAEENTCQPALEASISIVPEGTPPNTHVGNSIGTTWDMSRQRFSAFTGSISDPNRKLVENLRDEQLRARRAARQEQQRAREAAERAERRAVLNDFMSRHRVDVFVGQDCSLFGNPFNFEGQTILFVGGFMNMTARDKGVVYNSCGDAILTRIPSGTFSTRTSIMLAATVRGVESDQVHGARITYPVLEFRGVHFCETASCSEILR